MNQNMYNNNNGVNQQNQNMYNTDINSSRIYGSPNMNMSPNPYINQDLNNIQNMQNPQLQQNQSVFNNGDFIKGALIGAAVTFLLTNKGAQETIMKAASKGNELFQAGMEELKERYEDARAQMEANKE